MKKCATAVGMIVTLTIPLLSSCSNPGLGFQLRPNRNNGTQPGRVLYLSPAGQDQGPGTEQRPWQSLEKASREARAGDTVILLPGTYSGTLSPANSGTLEAPIVFRSEPRRQAHLAGGEAEAHAVLMQGIGHIRIEGLHIRHRHPNGHCLELNKCSHVDIVDCLMELDGVPERYVPVRIRHCEQLRLVDNMTRNALGNLPQIEHSRHVLIEGNAFSRAGHCNLLVYPEGTNRYITIRGNVFHGAHGRNCNIHAEDVLFENNIITNAFNSGRSAGPCRSVRRRTNWCLTVPCGGTGTIR